MENYDKLVSLLKPGDVINKHADKLKWSDPLNSFIQWGIQRYQKSLFGKVSDYKFTHTVLYFSPEQILSTTAPQVEWETLEHRCHTPFTVYRFKKHEYNEEHIKIMYDAASEMIGLKYDIGDILDLVINSILGYKYTRKYRWFEFSKKQMVCATSVRAIQEKLRKILDDKKDYTFSRLFNKLNSNKWSAKDLKKFERTDVEMTTPAHYSNSDWFEGEFEKICNWPDL